MSNFRVVSRGIKKIVTNHYHARFMAYGAMCPQQFFSPRSLSRIFQEDLKFFQINGVLAKEGAN
jgi:hypothetical protein